MVLCYVLYLHEYMVDEGFTTHVSRSSESCSSTDVEVGFGCVPIHNYSYPYQLPSQGDIHIQSPLYLPL